MSRDLARYTYFENNFVEVQSIWRKNFGCLHNISIEPE